MPGPFVIDASVFLNAFITSETGSEISKGILSRMQAQAIPMIAPVLLLPETAAAISRGQDDPELAHRYAVALARLPHLLLIPVDHALSRQAMSTAAFHRLRGSDAVYTAVAIRFGCPLVTLDKEQHDRVADVIQTCYPSDLLKLI